MPEQLREIAGRFVWGTPNLDENGRLITPSGCRSCVQWSTTGWIKSTREWSWGCLLHYADAPHGRECRDYAREPGADDQ